MIFKKIKNLRINLGFMKTFLGPTRFMTIYSCFELGIIDLLKKNKTMTATEIQKSVQLHYTDFVRQILYPLVKLGLLEYNSQNDTFTLVDVLSEKDYEAIAISMNLMKTCCYRQLYYLPQSLKKGRPVGLTEIYGKYNNLYEASAEEPELRDAWHPFMNMAMESYDPWFFSKLDLKPNSKVLDLAGNAGEGAVALQKYFAERKLHVTAFDLPFNEKEAVENFREADLQDSCSFIGGDIFKGVPRGYDVITLKHFLGMYSEENIKKIFKNVYDSMNKDAEFFNLVSIYAKNLKFSPMVDFAPGYFIGCTMGQGGNQTLSTYTRWAEEVGFKVTRTAKKRFQGLIALKKGY